MYHVYCHRYCPYYLLVMVVLVILYPLLDGSIVFADLLQIVGVFLYLLLNECICNFIGPARSLSVVMSGTRGFLDG